MAQKAAVRLAKTLNVIVRLAGEKRGAMPRIDAAALLSRLMPRT